MFNKLSGLRKHDTLCLVYLYILLYKLPIQITLKRFFQKTAKNMSL